jgi:hypothetical protein
VNFFTKHVLSIPSASGVIFLTREGQFDVGCLLNWAR